MGDPKLVRVVLDSLKCRSHATHTEYNSGHDGNVVSLDNGNPLGANRQWTTPSYISQRDLPLPCAASEINPGVLQTETQRDIESRSMNVCQTSIITPLHRPETELPERSDILNARQIGRYFGRDRLEVLLKEAVRYKHLL